MQLTPAALSFHATPLYLSIVVTFIYSTDTGLWNSLSCPDMQSFVFLNLVTPPQFGRQAEWNER